MNRIEGFLKRIEMDPATQAEQTYAFLGRVQTQCVLSIAYENQVAPRLPLKLYPGLIQTQNGETYKFERDPQHGWVLSDLHDGAWRQYISFTDDPRYDVAFLQLSFFCEAHPASPFNKKPIIAIKTPEGRAPSTDASTRCLREKCSSISRKTSPMSACMRC